MIFPDVTYLSIFGAYIAFAIVMVWAGWRGGGPERAGVLVLLGMLVLQITTRNIEGELQALEAFDWPTFLADLFGAAAFIVIAIWADRVWPIRAWTLQGLAVLGHLLQASAEMIGYTFVALGIWPTMLVMPLLVIGTEAHQYRLRRDGKDRDWVPLKQYADIREELDL